MLKRIHNFLNSHFGAVTFCGALGGLGLYVDLKFAPSEFDVIPAWVAGMAIGFTCWGVLLLALGSLVPHSGNSH